MRKYIMATVFFVLFVCFGGPIENLLSRFLRLEKPTFHEIQQGDWLSKVAQKYYGDASYWKELELINRAPDGDKIYPGEKIIVPSFDVVQKVRHTVRLSVVNELVQEQQTILAENTSDIQPLQTESEKELSEEIQAEVVENFEEFEEVDNLADIDDAATLTTAENNSPMMMFLFGGIILLSLGLFVGIIRYLLKKKGDEVTYYGETKEEDQDTSVNRNIYLDSFEENSEEGAQVAEKESNNKETKQLN